MIRFFVIGCIFFLPLTGNGQIETTGSNLPILIIDTEMGFIQDEPKVTAVLKIIHNPDGQRNHLDDEPTDYNGFIGIELRGSSSQGFPKPGYGFETRLGDGSNNNVSFLNFPTENDWVLHGPFSDKSLIRNPMSYLLAAKIMDYAPRVAHCELIIDGDYKGVYVLTEKIKRDNDRVDIERNEEDITGGYILKIDKSTGLNSGGFISNYPPVISQQQFIQYQYHYPKFDEITEAQKEYISNFVHNFEDAMADIFSDPQDSTYLDFIDIDQASSYILINELTKNPDAYRLSSFLYKDRDSIDARLKLGPVWDYNLALGNVNYCTDGNISGWVLNFNSVCENDFWLIPSWYKALRASNIFSDHIVEKWNSLRASAFSDENLTILIDSLSQHLTESQQRNFNRWPILNEYIWPNYTLEGSYQGEIARLRKWTIDRAHWMDENLENFFNSDVIVSGSPGTNSVNPNPFTDVLNISYFKPQFLNTRIDIYNSVGKLVFREEKTENINGQFNINLQTHHWSQGIYFVSILIGDDRESFKVVKI